MKCNETKIRFLSGEYNDRLLDIYIDPASLDYQKLRYIDAITEFHKLFGDKDIQIFSAPGRTEVGGNHTDHQHGKVLAASINDDVIAITSPREDGAINLLSKGYDMITFDIDSITAPDEAEYGTTTSIIKGVIAGLSARGYKVGGFNAYLTSDVLGGSGLSSSAAFETVIGTIESGLYNDMSIDAITIAKIGQYAENIYFGKPCGLMDQMACSVGSLCYIDFKNPEDPVVEKIDLDLEAENYRLVIVDTKGSHADLTPDYAAVPSEMCSIASHFGKSVLREVPEEDVIKNIDELRNKYGDRAVLRALHFYAENQRVDYEVEYLKKGNFKKFLSLVRKSGDSSYKYLQNVYTNHDVQHQNMSIALCISERILVFLDDGAARVHGGGFAGTIQAFVYKDKVKEYTTALDNIFGEGSSKVLEIRKYGGIRV